MQVIERDGYSREEILDVLHAKNNSRNVRFRYDLYNKEGVFKETLKSVLSGEVEQSAFSTIKRTAKFLIKEEVVPSYLDQRDEQFTLTQTTTQDFSGGTHNGTTNVPNRIGFAVSPAEFATNGDMDTGIQSTPAENAGLPSFWNAYGNTAGTQNRVTFVANTSYGYAGTRGLRLTRVSTGVMGIRTANLGAVSVITGDTIYISCLYRAGTNHTAPNYVRLVYNDLTESTATATGSAIDMGNGWFRVIYSVVANKTTTAGILVGWSVAFASGYVDIDNITFTKIMPVFQADWTSPAYTLTDTSRGTVKSSTVQYIGVGTSGSSFIIQTQISKDGGSTWTAYTGQATNASLQGLTNGSQLNIPLMYRYKVFLTRLTVGDVVQLSELTVSVTKAINDYTPATTKIDYLSDRIKPHMEIEMPDGKWVAFSLGVFLLSSPTRYDGVNGEVYREIEAYDGLLILDEDKVTSIYTVPAGTKYTDAVKSILNSAGVAGTIQHMIEDSTKTLTAAKEFKTGTSKLAAVNELLTAINYTPLWVDSEGFFQAYPYVSPAERYTDYLYEDNQLSVTYNGMEEELDLNSVPNIWSAVESNPDKPAPLMTRLTNADPNSPTSTVSLGRRVVDFREVDEMADQATLNLYVRRIAFEANQIFGKLKFKTALMPFHEYSDILHVRYAPLGVDHQFSETNWKMELRAGGAMEHEVRRVVSINVT